MPNKQKDEIKRYRADTPVCPYGKAIRQKNKKQTNVGAHRCVRPKTHKQRNLRADTPVCPYEKNNSNEIVGAHRCVRPKTHKQRNLRADTPVCPYEKNNSNEIVGAHRCVRPKTHRQTAGQTHRSAPTGNDNKTQEHKNK